MAVLRENFTFPLSFFPMSFDRPALSATGPENPPRISGCRQYIPSKFREEAWWVCIVEVRVARVARRAVPSHRRMDSPFSRNPPFVTPAMRTSMSALGSRGAASSTFR